MVEEIPDEVGRYRYATLEDANDVLLCRLDHPAEMPVPNGAVRVPDLSGSGHSTSIVVAYASRCTHMGCYLLPSPATKCEGTLPEGAVLRCPCHWSCFDLGNRGITVMAPATDWLPQVCLKLNLEGPEGPTVQLAGWIERNSVGRGVPYGSTSSASET